MTRSPGASLRLLVATATIGTLLISASSVLAESPRTGELHVTKECSQYNRLPGGFCTITSSNINAIKVGSLVVYASAPANGVLDSDITIVRNGNSIAYGHVTIGFGAGSGTLTLNGGTGEFIGFSATVVVTHPGQWAWDGTYEFSPPGLSSLRLRKAGQG